MQNKNVVEEKSYKFALQIISLCKILRNERKEYIVSKQLLRSGTSIGANIQEAQYSPSKKDFIHKLNIALKEANETKYWIRLLRDSKTTSEDEIKDLVPAISEIIALLISIIKSTKIRML